MNTLQITNVVPETEDVEPATFRTLGASRKTATRAVRESRLRYVWFAILVLALVAFALTMQHSINGLEAQIDELNVSLGPSFF